MNRVNTQKTSRIFLFISLILLSIAIRLIFFYIYSQDTNRIEAGWYDVFIHVGRIDAFRVVFYNYPPPLLYLIDVTTLFRFIPKEVAIKLISVIFDFFAAWGMYKILAFKFPNNNYKWIGYFALLLLPTVFVESGMWGQSDIIYTSFLLWTFYFLLKSQNFKAILFFSIAFSFKLQAAYFAPIFVILFFKKKFPFKWFFVFPIVYFISIVPAWLAGGPLKDLLLMYYSQFNTYNSLSMRAPNLYLFIKPGNYYQAIVYAGMGIAFIIVLGYIILRIIKYKDINVESLCWDAFLITYFIPFLLPKMHERYFFTGGIFLLLLVFFHPKLIWAVFLSQAASLMSFIPYFSSWSDIFAKIGAIFNVLLIIGLIIYYIGYKNELRDQVISAGKPTIPQ
jgi:Gpi18-like mannosyltransferase